MELGSRIAPASGKQDFIKDLDTPLLRLSGHDVWTGRDATSHTDFLGRIGGGKTSATKEFVGAMLRAGCGGFITSAKPEDIQLWQDYAKAHGREHSLVLFDEENEGSK